MNILTNNFSGHIVNLKTTNPLHYKEEVRKPINDDVPSSFAGLLNDALGKVNNLQLEANDLSQKMIYQPESVDIHNVMIAAQKAEIALNFTKAIRDEAIKSFRELINIR